MTVFRGTNNKAVVRQQWDLPIIQGWEAKTGKRLAYFGLPGPQLEDVLDWRDCLDHCTGVERLRKGTPEEPADLEVHRQLMTNVFDKGLSGKFSLLRGDIHDIILTGVDGDKRRPPRSVDGSIQNMRFRYDLVNLDFFGGMGQDCAKNLESKRVRAIQKLFERQQGTNFLFLLTLSTRDKIAKEYTVYLTQIANELTGISKETFEWYAARGKREVVYKLKAVVPLFVRDEAGRQGFSAYAYPPLTYIGTGNVRMVHFAFALTYSPRTLRTFSEQSVDAVLNLPLMSVEDEHLQIVEVRRPNFDFSKWPELFSFLSETVRETLLQMVPYYAISENS